MNNSLEIVSNLPRREAGKLVKQAVLVACHPDDEVLWFSSILGCVRAVIIAFPDSRNPKIAEGRRQALQAHPRKDILSLRLKEASVFGLGGRNPVLTSYGINLGNSAAAGAYQSNFDQLLDSLRPLLEGPREVFTHGPWGEYGHPEHIQVYRAVRRIQHENGFRLWFPNYVSARAERLRIQLGDSLKVSCWISLTPNLELARRVQNVYVSNGCWTWYSSYQWPQSEEFLAQNVHALSGESLSDYPPLLINRQLGAADRLRWRKTAARRVFDASAAGLFIAAMVSRMRNFRALPR